MSTSTSAGGDTAPAPGATPRANPNQPALATSDSNSNSNGISAGTSVSSASPAPSSSLATTPAPDAVPVPAPSTSSTAEPGAANGSITAPAAASTCGVCKQEINQPGFKTCVRCRMKRNAARKRRVEARKGNGSVPGTGASTPMKGLKLEEESTEGSVASEGDVAMEHEQEEGSEPLTREGSHAPLEDEEDGGEEENGPDGNGRTALLAAATATLGVAAVALAQSNISAQQTMNAAVGAVVANRAAANTTTALAAAAALAEDEESGAEDDNGDVEMKDDAPSRPLSPPTPSPPVVPPPQSITAPAPRPPLDVARLDAEFEAKQRAQASAPIPTLHPVASASAPPASSSVDGPPCTVCKGPRDNAKYKTCAACRARSRESWRRQSAKRKALQATGGQPTPVSSARPTPTTSRANSPTPAISAPVASTTVAPIQVYEPPPLDPGAPVPGGTIISGVGGSAAIPPPAGAVPMLAPIPVSSGPPTPAIDPEKQRRLCSSCRSALAPPRYRTCEHCRWITRRDAAAQSGQPFTEAEPPTSRLGARRGRKRVNPAEPRVERPGKKRRVLFEVDEDEYTFEGEALEVVRDCVKRGEGEGGGGGVRVTWAVVAGEKGGVGRIARLERVAEAMRSKGIPISADSEEQEPGSSPYAGPDAVTERWTCQCTHSPQPEDDAMDVDDAACGGYVYVSCGWDTHSHPAHLRGQRVTVVVVHGQPEEAVANGEETKEAQEPAVMVEAPTPMVDA